MDIQTKKLWLIERLLKIQDEVLINRLKTFLENFNQKEEENVTPMSLESFYARIEESEKDILDGNTISHEQLKKEIETWGKS
ncbi:MAG: hypothetical protein GY940_29095 [bacterium]|nr:hypothetical protein [bacterium]